MRLLFLTGSEPDYMSDSLLHGLRSLLGDAVVDYPKADRLYRTLPAEVRLNLYGHGFSLYGLLDDSPVDRSDMVTKVRLNYFDTVIFGNIWRNWQQWKALHSLLNPRNCAVVDGEDGQNIFPYSRRYLMSQGRMFLPRTSQFTYFKRELTCKSIRSRWYFLPPAALAKSLPVPKRILPISFSIPAEKILAADPVKTKTFPCHIVDAQVRKTLGTGQEQYPFSSESEYYGDLQRSRFGITTKRSGWDCMRHYEIAANSAVLCFRGLQSKERTCAPHGLNSSNCLAYEDAGDLLRKIERLTPNRYEDLRMGALLWARQNTTVKRATAVLSSLRRP